MAETSEKNSVIVIGAGFSGLVSAFYLVRAGFTVEVHEASQRVGGVIDSIETDFARIEVAANGLLASPRVEALFEAAQVRALEAAPQGRKRSIFREGKARRWPLSFGESLLLLGRLPFLRSKKPKEGETVELWARRAVGEAAYRYGIVPALQGIYAGDPAEMSAELVFGRFFGRKSSPRFPRGGKRGIVAPPGGMRALLEGLRRTLESEGVRFRFGSRPHLAALRKPVVIATSLPAAREILVGMHPEVSETFAAVRMLPLICVHATFPRESPHLDGFGCLFPRGEGVRALGVLFEESIFGERSGAHLERWILGGATDSEIMNLSDEEVYGTVRGDRAKLLGMDVPPQDRAITRWDSVIPHYDLRLCEALGSPALRALSKSGVFLIGNYLGKLGLSGILEEAEKLPLRIRQEGRA
jgi:oxygen-dependent protoporphyrinogen oxidase